MMVDYLPLTGTVEVFPSAIPMVTFYDITHDLINFFLGSFSNRVYLTTNIMLASVSIPCRFYLLFYGRNHGH